MSPYCISFVEPVGQLKPRIAIKSIEINEVPLGDTFVGHCPGQGYPVPVYRYTF